jgi:hypothetical protein
VDDCFQDWAISLIGANPPTGQSKKGADRGIDGLILFYDRVDIRQPQLRKILVLVKGGGTGRGDIAKLKGDMDREGAPMGVLLTLNEPTPEMKREAALAGDYQYSASVPFPKIQILSMKLAHEGRQSTLMQRWLIKPKLAKITFTPVRNEVDLARDRPVILTDRRGASANHVHGCGRWHRQHSRLVSAPRWS